MNSKAHEFDVIGVGFGPANISLAIAIKEMNLPLSVKFLECAGDSVWQKGMLIDNSDVQNHPLRDLVTPRNPRSRYSFVNYLFEQGRLFEHLNLGMIFPFRIEYAKYIEWVAAHFSHLVRYNTKVSRIELTENNGQYGSEFRLTTDDGIEYKAASIVVGTGRTPFIPPAFQQVSSPALCHIGNYLESVQSILSVNPRARIAVIGSSQSAVEVILHLSDNYPQANITGILRSFGYRLKDTSPFTCEVYFPEFVDLFYNASPIQKSRLSKDLYFTNYGAVDGDVLDRLYRKMYMQKVADRQTISLHRAADISEVNTRGQQITLRFNKMEKQEVIEENFDLVVLGTGFKNIGTRENEERWPAMLQHLQPYFDTDENGCIQVDYNYRLRFNNRANTDTACFLNGLCESTHGMGDAGSFSLLSLRAKTITEALMQLKSKRSVKPYTLSENPFDI